MYLNGIEHILKMSPPDLSFVLTYQLVPFVPLQQSFRIDCLPLDTFLYYPVPGIARQMIGSKLTKRCDDFVSLVNVRLKSKVYCLAYV